MNRMLWNSMINEIDRRTNPLRQKEKPKQYFDENGNYYDWDDEEYLQGSVDFEDIFSEDDLC